jgi:hypothetical protein
LGIAQCECTLKRLVSARAAKVQHGRKAQ